MSLYQFQAEDVLKIVPRKRQLLTHHPGLGKTRIAVKCIEAWRERAIVFCRKNDIYIWEDEILQNTNLKPLIYNGKISERKAQREQWESGDFDIFITHYAYTKEVLEKVSRFWGTLIADEYHLYGLINRKSITFKMFKFFKTVNILFITGTPVRRDPSDLWAPIHLIDPKNYRSYWRFVNMYCEQEEDYFGNKRIKPRPKNPKALQYLLYSRFMVRRAKSEIEDQLPSQKARAVLLVEMNPEQKKMYNAMDKQMLIELESVETPEQLEYIIASSGAEKVIRLRQLLISPKLLGGKSNGGALDDLLDRLEAHLAEPIPPAIYVCTPFRLGVDIIAEAINKRFIAYTTSKLMGGLGAEKSHEIIQSFQDGTTPRVLITTIKSAVGFTAHAAKVGYFLGAEWSAIENVQAEDRIHRIGQTNDVVINYLVHRKTVERKVLKVVGDKMIAEQSTLGK